MTKNNLILGVFLVFVLGIFFLFSGDKEDAKNETKTSNLAVNRASADEIYPVFECSCCNKPIDECSCPMAKERMAFVEGLTIGGISEEETIMAYVQKYGINSFVDENKKEELRQKLAENAPTDRPIVYLDPASYDLGDISQKKGIVKTAFKIRNDGLNDLVIDKLETSCGCTTASVVFDGEEGPVFGMPGHGINEEIGEWQLALPPGAEAELRVYYDPGVHQDFRGSAIRTISVFTNDPVDFEKRVQIELNQVD